MSEKRSREQPDQGLKGERDRRAWLLSGVLVFGMMLAAVAGYFLFSQLFNASLSPRAAGGLDSKSIGAASAPLAVVVYSDFQ